VNPEDKTRGRTWRWRLLLATVAVFVATTITACIGNDEAQISRSDLTPTSAPSIVPSDEPEYLEPSVLQVRSTADHSEAIGSAVVLSDEGMLLTSASVIEQDIEIVLPDGSVHRPALVTAEPTIGLALLKVPASGLAPASVSSSRLATGAEVFATGFDGSPGALGRMSGRVVDSVEGESDLPFRVRGATFLDTDINVIDGFLGGALSDGDGGFLGVLVAGETEGGSPAFRAVSHWFILAWMEHRQQRLDRLSADAAAWERLDLPNGWTIRVPDTWNLSIATDEADAFRAEMTPADPDVPLQLAIAVEPNQYGTDPWEFVAETFEQRSSARVWSVDDRGDYRTVRISMSQEGALVDVAYALDPSHLIALSLRSAYQPGDDQAQVDEARALFDIVMATLERN
jgi:hypothetical protein